MVSSVISCPFCQCPESVVKHGTNCGGTALLRCLACRKTFTPAPNPRRVTEETEQKILGALSECLSTEAITRPPRGIRYCRVADTRWSWSGAPHEVGVND